MAFVEAAVQMGFRGRTGTSTVRSGERRGLLSVTIPRTELRDGKPGWAIQRQDPISTAMGRTSLTVRHDAGEAAA